jgi:hypothetical protein
MSGFYYDKHGNLQPDRRSGEDRRKNKDRREDIRWEPGTEDRRKGKDRRRVLTGGWNEVPRK